MNRTLTVGMFAGIFAIAMGAIILSGDSASTFMVSAVPQTQETMGMVGHVEYTVRDESNQVKSYMQTDNVVTANGKSCVASNMFDTAELVNCQVAGQFQYIAIGNATDGVDENQLLLDVGSVDTDGDGCGDTGTNAAEGGEMARKLVDPAITTVGTDSQVVLDTSGDPFEFRANNATNTTVVMQSGIFNGDVHASDAVTSHCTDNNTSTDDLFAIQDLNTSTGITVTAGDSLSVKWTITVGST